MKKKKDDLDEITKMVKEAIVWSDALQEDYTTRMAALLGISPEEILKTIQALSEKKSRLIDAQINLSAQSNPQLIELNLPEKPKKRSEVQIPYSIYVCDKFSISWDAENFNLKKVQDDISAKCPKIAVVLFQYFTACQDCQISYHKLKINKGETVENYYKLEKEMKAKKKILDDILKKSSAKSSLKRK